MWFKVLKPFGHALEGDLLELKEDSQYKTLIKSGLIEETDAPKVEIKPVTTEAYSTETILNPDDKAKAAGRPKKEEK